MSVDTSAHRTWRSQFSKKPPEVSTHLYARHGAYPDLGEHVYAVRFHAPYGSVVPHLRAAIEARASGLSKAAEHKELSGGRWITVHPNGAHTEGEPLYITDNPDGTATVVAGAGGKLNGMRMGLVKSEDKYKEDMVKEAQEKRVADKASRDALQAKMGEEEYKRQTEEAAAAKQVERQKKLEAGRKFAATVLEAHGIDPQAILTVPEGAMDGVKADHAKQRIEEAHVRGVVSWAKKIAAGVRRDVAVAIEANAEVAGVSFADLAREVLSGNGPGYSLSPESINESRGIAPTKADRAEVVEQSALLRAEGDAEEAARRLASAAKLQAGAQAAREQIKASLARSAASGAGPGALAGIEPAPIPLERAGAILAAARELRQIEKPQAGVPTRPYSPVAFTPMEDGDATPAQDVADVARTMAVSKLVKTANDLEAAGQSLHAHISTARHQALMEAGASIVPGFRIDPALCDFLGSAGAARLVVETVRAHGGEDAVERLGKAVTGKHLAQQEKLCKQATDAALPLLERANMPLEVDGDDPEGLLAAQGALAQKMEYAGKARELLGKARGRLEASASLVWAAGRPEGEQMAVVMAGGYDRALAMSTAMLDGLERGKDYDLASPSSGKVALTVYPTAVGKLVQSPSKDRADRLGSAMAARSIEGPQDPPPGMRKTIDAMHPLMGIARKAYGEIGPHSHAAIRGYWARTQGIDAASESEPARTLTKEQEGPWRTWQDHLASGEGMGGVQRDLTGRFPVLASIDLDDDDAVLKAAGDMAEALGYDGVDVGGSTYYPALHGGRKAARAREAKGKLSRLMRSLWSHAQGAPEFDPDDVPSVSQAWTKFVRASGGDMKAVAKIQGVMQQDPSLQGGEGKPFKLTEGQARTIHLIRSNRRMAAALPPGAGKTNVIAGSFLQARADGEASRGIIAVPSAVQGQMGQEWERFVDPDAGVSIHAVPGAANHERHAALGGGADLTVMTHEGLRNAVVETVAAHQGITVEEAAQKLREGTAEDVDSAVHSATAAAGWDHDYLAVDEGHKTLDRSGKADSLLSNVIDSLSRKRRPDGRLPMYVYASGDPIKNDSSEAFSLLQKVAPDEYPDGAKDRFMRSYGRSTEDAAIALRQEMQPYMYTQAVDLPFQQHRADTIVSMDPEEQAAHDQVLEAYSRARLARVKGERDRDAEGVLGTNDPKAYALARDQKISAVLLQRPGGSRIRHVVDRLGQEPGRPAVVFARNRAAVENIAAELAKAGRRVDTITGGDSAGHKSRKRDKFQNGGTDVLVCTDAAEAGMNLQRGSLLVNFDVPMTSKTHEQRIARIARMGQVNDVDVENLSSDSHWDARNRARLKGKGALREILTAPFEVADDTGTLEYNLRRKAGV